MIINDLSNVASNLVWACGFQVTLKYTITLVCMLPHKTSQNYKDLTILKHSDSGRLNWTEEKKARLKEYYFILEAKIESRFPLAIITIS